MNIVSQVLEEKGHVIWSVARDAPVLEALQLMAEKNCGALLVVEDEKLVGLISERDYARKIALKGKSSRNTRVEEVMSRRVVYVQPSQTVDECMALMTEKRVRHLPVVDSDEKLVGMISIGDLVKAVISEQEFIIHQLENYITGSF